MCHRTLWSSIGFPSFEMSFPLPQCSVRPLDYILLVTAWITDFLSVFLSGLWLVGMALLSFLWFAGSAMAELGRLLIYEASRDWLVSIVYWLCLVRSALCTFLQQALTMVLSIEWCTETRDKHRAEYYSSILCLHWFSWTAHSERGSEHTVWSCRSGVHRS